MKANEPHQTSAHERTLTPIDAEGLLSFDDGWYQRLERALPAVGLRAAAANGLDPARDGLFRVSRVHQVNARARLGPEYTILAGAALALVDLGMSLGDDDPVRLEVRQRYWDYGRADGKQGFPDFDRERLREHLDEVSMLFVYGLGYLLLHEQYHYIRGHLCFLNKQGKSVSFLEATRGNVSGQADALTHRALELDADTNASVMQVFAAAAPGEVPSMTREWLEAGREEVVASFVGAAAMMGLLTFADRVNNEKPENRRHPSAALRTMMLLRTYDTFLEECNCDEKEAASLISDAVTQLRRIYGHLGVLDELDQALQARDGELPDDHPLQDERLAMQLRLRELMPELERAASEAEELLGIGES